MPTITAEPTLTRELAGVLTELNDRVLAVPAVRSAALILAAEAITSGRESCPVCPGLLGICPACAEASAQAALFRMLAREH